MKLTRINVCTLFLAVALVALATPAYNDLVAQIQGTVLSVFSWFPEPVLSGYRSFFIVFLYAVLGAGALCAARLLSRWIFAHATGESSSSH
ncbi:hypothetical protein LL998_34060 (plasmid) [Burkholderia ambifaria]|uniref:hypothetical protein n=1 Tax=Burkholderia ambifaria TaxID=152480 RepID=UPI001E441608|nr:hypothetical protein [Burkholderia ambifaria]UEP39766.1 hypothetical protein LL998_34060 [Burkholderia ambifaria]